MTDDTGLIAGLIKEHSGTKCQKVLTCAQDVADALAHISTPTPPRLPWEPDLAALTGIDVVVSPDAAPGTWRLLRHDHCDVIGGETPDQAMIVTHRNCTVLGENPGPGTGELADFDPGTGRSAQDDWGRD
jgi:hypothetical protein